MQILVRETSAKPDRKVLWLPRLQRNDGEYLMLMKNHDKRLQDFELMLEWPADEPIPVYPLPEGFHFSSFQEGDEAAWISILISAYGNHSNEQATETLRDIPGERHSDLSRRTVFVVDTNGEKVATGMVEDVCISGASSECCLQWIAVKKERQGLGLARPLAARLVQLMHEHDIHRMTASVHTTDWVACKILLDLGFRPVSESLTRSRTGWKIIKRLTDHPALSMVENASMHDLFPDHFPVGTEVTQEHSCGAVIFGLDSLHHMRYLLIQSLSGEWGFPKGHVEPGETDCETALREIREETGLSVELLKGFRRETIYRVRKAGKRVTYFLAQGNPDIPTEISDLSEVAQAVWCDPDDAQECLKAEDRQLVFQEALDHIEKRGYGT